MAYSSMTPGGLIPQAIPSYPYSAVSQSANYAVYSTPAVPAPTSASTPANPHSSEWYNYGGYGTTQADHYETYQSDTYQTDAYQSETYQAEAYQPEAYHSETYQSETYSTKNAEHISTKGGGYTQDVTGEWYWESEDGKSKFAINHWCDVCKVGLTTDRQMESHLEGKTHKKLLKAMNENSAQYAAFLRKKTGEDHMDAISWTCDMCSITLSSVEQYQAHLRGKAHEKKMRQLNGTAKVINYSCDLCGIELGTNRVQYDAHIDGKSHQKRLSVGKVDVEMADPAETAYYCDVCKIQMENASQYIAHLGGQQHAKRLGSGGVGDNCGLVASLDGSRSTTYWCDVCKVQMTGSQPFEAHINGVKHKTKAAKASGIEPLVENLPRKKPRKRPAEISGEAVEAPNGVFKSQRCEVCNVFLTSRASYEAHMHGQAHAKRKKMVDAYGGKMELKEGTLAKLIMDTGPSIKDGMLYCVLCNLKFNKVVLATEHFPGRKHKSQMASMEVNFFNGLKIDYFNKSAESTGKDGDGNNKFIGPITPATAADDAKPDNKYADNFVSCGAKILSSVPNVLLTDKADINAKLQGLAGNGASEGAETAANGGNAEAEAMDLLVKEISPHDTSAIVCTLCSIGVSTEQMLMNHVVGLKHIKRVVAIAVQEGKDIKSLKGKGVPGQGRGRGRGRGRGAEGGRGGGGRGANGSGVGGGRGTRGSQRGGGPMSAAYYGSGPPVSSRYSGASIVTSRGKGMRGGRGAFGGAENAFSAGYADGSGEYGYDDYSYDDQGYDDQGYGFSEDYGYEDFGGGYY